MKRVLLKFLNSEDGYVLVLTLMFLPVFFGIALLVIDVARGNNAHTDLQAAADSVAIAGAVELDQAPDAIDRAKAAMSQITNTVSMLQPVGSDVHINLVYADASGNEFDVHFLRDIPASDDTPIDQTWLNDYGTSDGTLAEYVHVRVQSEDLSPVFPIPLTGVRQSVPVGARAVATNPGPVLCNVAPVFLCNPFQNEGPAYSVLANAVNAGRLHGRLFTLISSPRNGRAGPGNWGYLRTPAGPGANVLRAALAGFNPACYSGNTVDTKPGKTASVRQGFNTRFGEYAGPMNRDRDLYPPDVNLNEFLNADGDVMGNEVMVPPNGPGAAAGAFLASDSNWNLRGECRDPSDDSIMFRGTKVNGGREVPGADRIVNEAAGTCVDAGVNGTWEPGYWELVHGKAWDDYLADDAPADFDTNLEIRTTYPNEAGILDEDTLPSRSDVYDFELAEGLELSPSGSMPNGATGRRELFSAIINCDGLDIRGATDDMPVLSFGTFFLPKKMDGPQESISMELIDLVGFAGSSSLDELTRLESYLVR